MSDQFWERLRQLFDQAIQLEPGARSAFAKENCKGDDALLEQLQSLIDSHGSETQLRNIVQGAAADFAEQHPETKKPETIGAYKIIDVLGHGGMGTVYLAERADKQFQHQVAIKVVRLHSANADVVERFRAERQILASFNHANIATLLDGGETTDGLPYLVMEYVQGTSITEFCDQKNYSTTDRLTLFLSICDAVQYAHQNLVIHRDIKPSNILVTDNGIPKLLDFGVAKILREDLLTGGQLTMANMRVLTPDYASPEQILGSNITTATDVYALGMLLYELLTGHSPYRLSSYSAAEITALVCEKVPQRPSDFVATLVDQEQIPTAEQIASKRSTTHKRLKKAMTGDIDNIVMKALRKEPEQRYPSVNQFAEDIERFLTGLPVRARPPTWGYRAGKFVRRNKANLAVASAVLMAFAATNVFYTTRLTAERDRALVEARRAQEVATFVTDLFEVSTPDQSRGAEVTARQMLDRGANRIGVELRNQPMVQLSLMQVIGTAYAKLGLDKMAAKTLEAALARHEALEIADDAVLGIILHNLGVVYHSQARHDESAMLLDRALRLRRELPSDTDTAATLRALASLAYELDDYDKAAEHLTEAEAIVRAMDPPALLAVADVLLARGDLIKRLGDNEGAIANYHEAIALRRELSGEDHPDTLIAQNNLADALIGAGRRAEAENILLEVVDARRRVLPAGHSDIATALENLATTIKYQGRPEDALPYQQEALEIYRVAFPADHPETAVSLNNLANLHHDLRDLDKALALHNESLAMKRRLFGDKHSTLAASYNNLAALAADRNDFEGALDMYQRTLEVDRKSLGEDHPYVHVDLIGIGVMQGRLGRLEEAETTLRQALDGIRRVSGEDHPQVYNALRELGIVLVQQDRCPDAEPYLAEALTGLENAYPGNPWEVANARTYLGACRVLTNPTAGEALMRQGHERLMTLRGPDDRMTRRAQERLTQFLRSHGRNEEADELE